MDAFLDSYKMISHSQVFEKYQWKHSWYSLLLEESQAYSLNEMWTPPRMISKELWKFSNLFY